MRVSAIACGVVMVASAIAIALLAIVGLFIGSFLGTLVLRLPEARSIVAGRSSCPHCGKQLTAVELIPLLSWAIQARRCRGCRQRISTFYPAMEIAAAVVPIWAGVSVSGATLLFSCALGWLLLALAVMDARVYRLSDALTLPMLIIGIAATAFLDWNHVLDRAIGVIAGFGVLVLLAQLYQAYRGQAGLGLGDAKLFGAGGAWIGWQGLAPAALIAGTVAIASILVARAMGRPIDARTKIPFGTFLAVGIWVVWLYVPTR